MDQIVALKIMNPCRDRSMPGPGTGQGISAGLALLSTDILFFCTFDGNGADLGPDPHLV